MPWICYKTLNKLFHDFPKPNKYYGKFLLIDALWNVYAYNLSDIYKLRNCLSENYKYIQKSHVQTLYQHNLTRKLVYNL